MCAINGCTWENGDLVRRMNEVTAHRGPDGTGVLEDSHVSLGHDRLSIIDPDKRSAQPMTSASGRYTITYNGELYNFQELKRELNSYPFRTESDTEVVLAAWERWGKEMLPKLNGMFAFAMFDTKERMLYLVRDRSGIKPLYYAHTKHGLVFSSEIKAILCAGVPSVLDRSALPLYLRLGYVPEPHTMFEGISKVSPGSLLVYKDGVSTIEKFWERVAPTTYIKDHDEAKDRVKVTVSQAVERQLVSDKPIGIYLSGGIDSSAVLAAASSVHQHIDTFSIGFELSSDEEPEKFNADADLAARTAAYFGARHHAYTIAPSDVVAHLEAVAYHLDEPSANPTAIVQYMLARHAKQTADVVLGGDGGDELFGGYERYRLSLLASYYQQMLPQVLRNRLSVSEKFRKLNTPAGVDRFALFHFQKDKVLAPLLADKALLAGAHAFFKNRFFSESVWSTFEEQFMDVDRMSWLVDESLLRTDKMAMAHGLEARVPLLDNEVVDISARIPLRYKVTPFATKRILKDAFQGVLPEELFRQPKRGWFSPAAKWLRHDDVFSFAKEVLSPSYCAATASLYNWDAIETMLERHRNKESYHLTEIWLLLAFQLWAHSYKVSVS